jgi:hypothetical protein
MFARLQYRKAGKVFAADAGKPRLGHEAVKEFPVRLRRRHD